MDDTRTLKTNWQTQLGVSGSVVSGDAGLEQFIRVAIGTQIGSVPQMLDFGVDWLAIIDMPVDDAIPLLLRSVNRVFRKWIEPRASLMRIEPITDGPRLAVLVHYKPAGSDRALMTEVTP